MDGVIEEQIPLQGVIAITDYGWYTFLSARTHITEVNFWTPSARAGFRAEPFSPFLFKLKSPYNAICGFAYFAQYSRLPDWLAWETFGTGNGCASFEEMRERIDLTLVLSNWRMFLIAEVSVTNGHVSRGADVGITSLENRV